MKITIDIPKEFEQHFNNDRFKDSLKRIITDVTDEIESDFSICGRYEIELCEMLIEAFEDAEYTEKHSKFIPFEKDDAMFLVEKGMPLFNGTCSDCGAMCFDDDTYCSECGSILDGE